MISLRAFSLVILLIGTGAASAPPPLEEEDLAPRLAYNQALAALDGGDLEAAEKGFTDSRDRAGADHELRYRSSFNLAMTFAARADEADSEDPAKEIEPLRQAAAWFRDSVRLRPDDGDARQNLEVILRRIQALADLLNKGQNSIEARLDRLIEDERGLREAIRGLVAKVDAAGAAAEPVGMEDAYRSQAAWQRTLLADADSLAGTVGEEVQGLQGKEEADRTDQDRVRMAQLQNVEVHLNQARERMADARLALRKLRGESAHRKSDAALRRLKRAREQLMDPATVLRGILQDEVVILGGTDALARAAAPAFRAGEGGEQGEEPEAPPAWLHAGYLHDLQEGNWEKTQEMHLRFAAATQRADEEPAGPSSEAAEGAAADERRMERLIQAAREAVPHLEDALRAMGSSAGSLDGDRPAEALPHERQALISIARAVERFSGIRELIEIVHGDQQVVVALLTPPEEEGAAGAEPRPSLEEVIPTEERAARIGEGAERNRERLERLRVLFEDEVAALDEQAAAGPSGEEADPDGEEAAEAEEARKKIEQQRELYSLAEEERAAAAAALKRVDVEAAAGGEEAAGVEGGEGPGDSLSAAVEALEYVETLRRLFFSIVEHLEELVREQGETYDETGSAAAESDPEKRQLRIGPLHQAQGRHAAKARAIASALSEQAEGAAAAPTPSHGNDAAAPFAQAAEEVTRGAEKMEAVTEDLGADDPEVEQVMERQEEALDHLLTALALLKPPESQDQQEQEEQPQDQDQQQISREQASRRLQEVREREADRRRRKEEHASSEAVEKDW